MQRLKELDFIRAMSIVGVVVIHASIQVFGNTDSSLASQFFGLVINQLSRFAVPSFLFVSGILAFHSFEQLEWGRLLVKRLFDLGVPYLVWTSLGLLLFPVKSSADLSYAFLLGQGPFYQLYYIPLLFQMYLLLPAVKKMASKSMLFILLTVTLMIFISYQAVQFGFIPVPRYIPIQNLIQATFLAWLVYFYLGYTAAKDYERFLSKIEKTSLSNIVIFYFLGVGILTADYYWNWINTGKLFGPIYDYYRISVFIYSMSSILLLFKIGMKVNSKLIAHLYRNSFGIYLNHLLVIIVLTKVSNFDLFSNVPRTLLGILLTLIISDMLSLLSGPAIFNKFIPGRKSGVSNSVN